MGTKPRITEDVWQTWLEPFHAVRLLMDAGLDNRSQAVDWLKARLSESALKAIGWGALLDDDFKVTDNFVASYSLRVCRAVSHIPWDHDFWVSGNFTPLDDDLSGIVYVNKSPGCQYDLSGTRFDPVPILMFCERYGQPAVGMVAQQQPKPTAGKGGRPPKPFWDQLWPSIAASLYLGDLKPAKQADIEKAMHEWLSANDQEAGEATIRRAARALWQAINKEDQN